MKLTPRQRLALIDHINVLVQVDFERLVFTLDAPASVIPSNFASQGDRSIALLSWVKGPNGCGMSELLDILGAIAPLPSELKEPSFPDPRPVPDPKKVWPNPGHRPAPIASDGVQIFLAYAKEDKSQVMELYERLRERGYRPWLDKKDLLPGQNWREEIPKAIKASHLFIACLSQTSVVKQGYVQREFRLAMSELAHKPPGQIYLIPLRLDACELPDIQLDEYGVNLRDYQWLDYFEADGFSRLEQTISYQFAELLSSQDVSSSEVVSSSPQGIESTVESSSKTITINQTVIERPSPEQTFEFEVVWVDKRGEIVKQQKSQVVYVIEDLGNGVTLEMVKIPGGVFEMRSASDEPERKDSEGSQHRVRVPSFWMGRYPVTQEQWMAIASMPQVNRELMPDPSRFKGDRFPVEYISWNEAVEACERLSAYTSHLYRLPSEAEWEYACRAGITTPFHFGETMTTDLANYRGTDYDVCSGSYGDGPDGAYRETTTAVNIFPNANAFGLVDMHGNVWEWCQDSWHKTYEGAPTDGSAWQETPLQNNRRVIRGGSWTDSPRFCRSAYRRLNFPDDLNDNIGFRVVLFLR